MNTFQIQNFCNLNEVRNNFKKMEIEKLMGTIDKKELSEFISIKGESSEKEVLKKILSRLCSLENVDYELVKKVAIELKKEGVSLKEALFSSLEVMSPKIQVIELLVSLGADVNARHPIDDGTALTSACFHEYPSKEVVSLLLSKKANKEMREKYGRNCLHLICEPENLLVEKIRNEADWKEYTGKRRVEEHLDIVKMLSDKKLVNSRGWHGRSALHFAAEFNRIETAKIVIKLGGLTNAKDKYKQTPLHVKRQTTKICL